MAEVKLVVMYPRPKDIDAFEKVYQNEHVPLAVAVLGGKTKIVGTKVLGFTARYSSFLSHRRDSFPVDGGSGGMRRVRRWEAGACPCRDDFFWWAAHFLSS